LLSFHFPISGEEEEMLQRWRQMEAYERKMQGGGGEEGEGVEGSAEVPASDPAAKGSGSNTKETESKRASKFESKHVERMAMQEERKRKQEEEAKKLKEERMRAKNDPKNDQKGNFNRDRNPVPTGPKVKPRRDSWRDEL
jgi:hypothetical protein